jgi:hypothetical protein
MSILFLYDGDNGLIGATGKICTGAARFDPDYDVSAVRILTNRFTPNPFSATWAAPSGDLWLGLRYRAPSSSTGSLAADSVFQEFRDAANAIVARVKIERDDATYRAQALTLSEVNSRPSIRLGAPAIAPRTVCDSQSVAAMISSMVAPPGARSMTMRVACLVPARCAHLGRCVTVLRLNADGGEACVGRDQRDAVAVTGLAPDGLAGAHVRVDLCDEAAGEQCALHLGGSPAAQALGQRQDDAVGMARRGAQDQQLGVGKLGHGRLPDRAARDARPSTATSPPVGGRRAMAAGCLAGRCIGVLRRSLPQWA